MKIHNLYFSKEHIQGFIVSFCFFLFSIYFITDSPQNYLIYLFLTFSIYLLYVFSYLLWTNKSNPNIVENHFDMFYTIINDKTIEYPIRYYFRQSSIYKMKAVNANQINEINLGTIPLTLVINHNEVIFVEQSKSEELQKFAERNSIPIVNRFDIWESINDVFLDTEYEEYVNDLTFDKLEENGLSREEVTKIRKQICLTMYLLTYQTWEWVYYGQFDYLRATILTQKKYWWSMEIALRNYNLRIPSKT